jgi:hypothetical protein
MKSRMLLFAALTVASSDARKKSSDIHALELFVCLCGRPLTFSKHISSTYFLTTRSGNFSLPSEFEDRRAVTHSLLFFSLWQASLSETIFWEEGWKECQSHQR